MESVKYSINVVSNEIKTFLKTKFRYLAINAERFGNI